MEIANHENNAKIRIKLELPGSIWNHFEEAGTTWNELELPGTAWNKVVPPAARWTHQRVDTNNKNS